MSGAPTTAPPSARRPRRGRWRFVVLALACVAAVVWLLADALSGNLVYFRTASEAVAERPRTGDARFRLAGAVKPGSRVPTADGVEFLVVEGGAEVEVLHHGDPPELFRDGAPVVCEGRWQGDRFVSDRIMIKHGEEYTPPSVPGIPVDPGVPAS